MMSTKNASGEILHLLEKHFVVLSSRGDVTRATQMAIAVLKSLELQKDEVINIEERRQVASWCKFSKESLGKQKRVFFVSQ